MKKNVFEMVVAMVNGQPVADMDTLRNEIHAEWDKMLAKSQAKADAYAQAKEVLCNLLSDVPQTAEQLFEGSDQWPAGFTVEKIRYGLRALWADNVERHVNGKNPMTYTAKY